ncbi:MAG: YjjG family noncanonical pyrimidine nucleotidase [Myxococcota bacterium]
MPYSWLLFDADGTLYDFRAAEASAIAKTFTHLGVEPSPDVTATYREINTRVWQQLERGELLPADLGERRFALIFEALGLDFDPADASARHFVHLSEGSELLAGAEALIEDLRRDHRLAIITNGLSAVQRPRFAASSIGHRFDPVVISDEVGVAKPDPRIFDLVFEGMGHPAKDEVLLIGDSLSSDIRGGSNYGLDTVWFNPQQKTAPSDLSITHQIAALTELPALVRGEP